MLGSESQGLILKHRMALGSGRCLIQGCVLGAGGSIPQGVVPATRREARASGEGDVARRRMSCNTLARWGANRLSR